MTSFYAGDDNIIVILGCGPKVSHFEIFLVWTETIFKRLRRQAAQGFLE